MVLKAEVLVLRRHVQSIHLCGDGELLNNVFVALLSAGWILLPVSLSSCAFFGVGCVSSVTFLHGTTAACSEGGGPGTNGQGLRHTHLC